MKYLKTYEKLKQKPVIIYYGNGQICAVKYYLNGKFHREDGPAHQYWYENGQKESEVYYINDKIHREDGSAIKTWNQNGKKAYEMYYLNAIYYTREEWLEKLKEIGSIHYQDELLKYEAEKYNL